MIKATIQNSPYCTEICFPCSETELSDKLGELGMDKEHLSPMATVLEIEPAELSMLVDSEVSIDALNYLDKQTVLSGSVTRQSRTTGGSRQLQVIERPLMTVDELKSMPKGNFIVMKTGAFSAQRIMRLSYENSAQVVLQVGDTV